MFNQANFWHFLSDLLQNKAIKESIQYIMILFLNSKMNQESTILENLRIVPTLNIPNSPRPF